MPVDWCLFSVVHEYLVLVLGGQPSSVICKLLLVRQKNTRRNILVIWDVLVELRVLELQYFWCGIMRLTMSASWPLAC